MKKRAIVTISIVAGVLVLGATAAIAGPVIYRDMIVGPAVAAPTVEATTAESGTPSGSEVDASTLTGTWQVAEGSFAGYRVDEVLNGTDVTVVGRTENVTGELTVDGLSLTAAEVSVDVASIATDAAARDGYFRDTALRVSEFPQASFSLSTPVTAATAPTAGEVQKLTATGELTIAGVTRPISVELEAAFDGSGGQVAGSIPITFSDFGVEAPNLGFVSVEGEGFVEFSLAIQAG